MRYDQPAKSSEKQQQQTKSPWAEPQPAEPSALRGDDLLGRLTVEEQLIARYRRRIEELSELHRRLMNDQQRQQAELTAVRLQLASAEADNRRLAADAVNLADALSIMARRYAEELAYRRSAEAAIKDLKQDGGEGIDVEAQWLTG